MTPNSLDLNRKINVRFSCGYAYFLAPHRKSALLLIYARILTVLIDISVIVALAWTRESIKTTHVYIEADLATKERALEKLVPAGPKLRRYKADYAVFAFLASL